MADSKEMQNQLNIQQQINKVLADRAGILDSQAKQITAQVQLAAELCKALDCKELEGLSSRLGEINDGLSGAADEADKLAKNSENVGKAGEDAAKKSGGLAGAFKKATKEVGALDVAAAGAAAGMAKGFKSAVADVQMLGAAAMTAAGNLMNIGKSIISIPFKVLGGLTSMAAKGGGGVNELKKAMEEVRGEFGSLATGEGKAVMDGFKDLTSASGALAQTGIPLSKIYGRGKGGLAAALKDVAEFAKEAGPAFHMLSGAMMANAGAMAMMNKGLGMSKAALVELQRQAHITGQDAGDMLTQTASMAIKMGDKFGISAKTMGKNMGSLIENFDKLGKMSTKQLGATAAYMAKLGLEASDLLGVVDKFDNFEGAAESVSMLNQSMGLQLDTMEMMNAENPAERIDMMRDAFHATGKSVEDLTRQEKALMAEQMGLSVTAMENALAAENQGVSYEDLEAGATEAEEQALTQEQAMSKLADSITKLTEGGGGGIQGFFDAFTKGFMKGLKQSKAFQEVLKAIRKALKIVFQFGKQVGKMFSDLMGEMGVWEGIKDLFDPKDLRNLLGINEKGGLTGTGLLGIFKKFKDALSGKGTYSPAQMADDMGKEFGKFFSAKGPAFKKLGDAFAKGIQMIGAIISGLIPFVVGKLSDMIKGMADFIRDPKGLKGAASGGIGGAIIGAIMDVGKALIAAAPVLLSAILDLLSAVFEQHGGKIIAIGGALFTFVLLKTLIFGAIAAAKAALFQVLVAKIVGMMTGGMDEAAKKAEKGGKSGKKIGKSMKTSMKEMGDGIGEFLKSIASIKPSDILKAAINMALIAASFIPAMIVFAIGLAAMALVLSLVPFGVLIKGIVAVTMAIPAVAMMILTSQLINPGMIPTALLGLLAGALLLVVGGIAFAGALALIGVVVMKFGIGNILASIPALIALGLGSIAMAAAIVPLALLGLLAPLAIVAAFGMVVAASMLTVGGVAFTMALATIGKTVLGVGLKTIGAAILGMAAIGIAGAAVSLAAVALALGAPFFGAGIAGAILGAVFMVVGLIPFTLGLALYMSFAEGFPFGKALLTVFALALIAGFSVVSALVFAKGAVPFVAGAVGALLGGLYFGVLGKITMPALKAAHDAMPGDMKGAAQAMGKLAILMGFALITAILMAQAMIPFVLGTVAAYVSGFFFKFLAEKTLPGVQQFMDAAPKNLVKANVVMFGLMILMGLATLTAVIMAYGAMSYIVGIIGAIAAKPFFEMLTRMMPSLIEFANSASVGDVQKAAKIATMMAVVMVAAAVMGVASLVMIIFANPITAWLAKKGFQAAGKMLDAMVEHLGPSVQALAKMKVADPNALTGVVNAISGIMDALGSNIDIVFKLALLQAFVGEDASVLKDSESFMTSMFEGMKGIMNTLKRMVSSMKEEDVKKMESIGGVMSAIGDLMTALQPPPALLDALADMAGGGFFKDADPKGAADLLKEYGNMMKMLLEAIKANIPPTVKSILKIDVGPDPKLAEAKSKIIGAAMQGIGSVVGAIGGIIGLFMEQNQSQQSGMFRKSGPSMADTLREMKPVVTYIMTAIKDNMGPILKSVLDAVPEDIDAKAAEGKIKIIGGAMAAVADFAKTIGTVADLMPAEGGGFLKKGKSMSERLGEMMQIIRKIVNAVRTHIGPLVKSVTGIKIDGDPKALLQKLEIIGKAMEAVSTFASVVAQLKDLKGGFFDISLLMQMIVMQIINSVQGTPYTLDKLFPVLAEFAGTTDQIGKLDVLRETFMKLGDFASAMADLHESGALSGGGVFGVANSPFVEGVRMMVEQTKFALMQLNSLGEMDANVALENFASAIGTGGGEFTISNEPINITINMNVTMDANKVGRVLVDKSVMTTPLAAAE